MLQSSGSEFNFVKPTNGMSTVRTPQVLLSPKGGLSTTRTTFLGTYIQSYPKTWYLSPSHTLPIDHIFTVYVLAISPGGGFVEKIFKTKTFKIFHGYVAWAIIMSAILVLLTIPVTASKIPMIGDKNMYMSIWYFFLVTSFLLIFRVIRVFMVLVKVEMNKSNSISHA